MRRVLVLAAALAGCADIPGATPEPAAPVVAATPPPARPTPPRTARRASAEATTAWRAAADGLTACADPAALRQLRAEAEPGAAGLRRLAAARAAGGCVTVFRSLSWRLAEQNGDLLRLAPLGAAPAGVSGPLWFWRDEVTEERAANP